MTETVNLTIKIDPALKEHIKQLAADNQISMSQEIVNRLQASLDTVEPPVVDSLHTEEAGDQLSAAELKQVRALLKKSKKKK
ncbi:MULTISPECIES: hypothetical protein [Pantoea]|jgi:hypothetical protein|uniref:Arc family DNA-binding protein n=1 Tax=Pantoea dispersa TaxID=59814 RepID=A0ABY3A4Y9_9GAMM|nr:MULTISPECIES: hypothetical protein [Pantoea]MBS0899019.1 hypothetical protein [Pantoea dispersa]MBS0906937.1 hypothetical protein [Pantoea dispersa]MCW0319725.1 hypothetical protein [Pantoea dispersa]MCW0324461.1 hypothetical protein [Pantoea dispersa]MCW0431812.1 hypothetical protein [Pantoea dispersa]